MHLSIYGGSGRNNGGSCSSSNSVVDLSDYVTLDTAQEITGQKTFQSVNNILNASQVVTNSITTNIIFSASNSLDVNASSLVTLVTPNVYATGDLSAKSATITENITVGSNNTNILIRSDFANNILTLGGAGGKVQYVPAYNPFGPTDINRGIPSSENIVNLTPHIELITLLINNDAGYVTGLLPIRNPDPLNTNTAIFPSVYYGYSGSAGTYDLAATSGAMGTIVISEITTGTFRYGLTKGTGDNMNVYIQFLVVYSLVNSDYPKTY